MQKRKLGKSGIEVAPLMFGGNVLGWTADENMSFRLLDGFVGAGFNFIDTADIYSVWAPGHKGGESETILGKWMEARGNRSRVILATKVGMELAPDKKGLKKNYILRAVEDSLRRLRTDYIDLYQAHVDDPSTPLEETMEAFAQLQRQGKVRALGGSNYSAERLEESLRVCAKQGYPRFESLQPLYNLYDREEFETKLAPVCREHGLGVINFYSLASGFLTGKYRSAADQSKSVRGGRMDRYLNERGLRILSALDSVSARLGAKPSQVAVAWLIAQPVITAPIASATSPEQLSDLLEGTRLRLDPPALADLARASAY